MNQHSAPLPDGIFESVFDAASDAILVVDGDGNILLANPGAERLFAYPADELVGQSIELLVPAERRDAHVNHRAQFALSPRTRPMGRAMDLRARRKDGTTVPVDILLSPLPTENGPLVSAVVRDMTEYRSAQEQLEHLADHDELTGLYNRRRFEREIAKHVAQAHRYGGGALLMIDVDRFKEINDTYGHAAGDQVLQDVASSLRSRLRATDEVARFGGDEFALLLPHASRAEAKLVAQAIVHARRTQSVALGGDQAKVTVSIGIAPVEPASTPDGVLLAADAALYEAKRSGRDRVKTAAA